MSGIDVATNLKRSTRREFRRRPADRRSGPKPPPTCLILLHTGFAEPAGHPTAGRLLPHHFTLTSEEAVSFCCTFRRLHGCPRRRLPVRKRVVLRSSDFPHCETTRGPQRGCPLSPRTVTDQISPSSTISSTSSARCSVIRIRPQFSHVYILSLAYFISMIRCEGMAE